MEEKAIAVAIYEKEKNRTRPMRINTVVCNITRPKRHSSLDNKKEYTRGKKRMPNHRKSTANKKKANEKRTKNNGNHSRVLISSLLHADRHEIQPVRV